MNNVHPAIAAALAAVAPDPLVNTKADVYDLVRRNALREAEIVCHEYILRCLQNDNFPASYVADDIAKLIRALDKPELSNAERFAKAAGLA